MRLVAVGAALAVLAASVHAQGLRVGPGGSRVAPPSNTLGALAAGASAGQRSADFIVAIVNSEPITNHEVIARAERMAYQMRQQGEPVPERAELLRAMLDRLVSERAQLHLAREQGVRIDDAQVDQAERNIAVQNGIDVTELRRRLVADGLPATQLRDELRNQMVLQRLRDRELEARVRVRDSDIDAYLREQRNQASVEALALNLAHILVSVPEGANSTQVAALEARAKRAVERAAAGADFSALAAEFSDAPERASGGVLGLRPLDRLPSLFAEAARAAPVGAVLGPLRSGAGFHVLKVIERQQDGQTGPQVTQTRARHILLRVSARQNEAQARARLEAWREQIQAGTLDFATVAREQSQDASARAGGDLGWASPGQFVAEFEDVMNSLAPGEVSRPLVSRFGVHLIQVVERRETTLSEREQREQARQVLRERKLDEAFEAWSDEVRGRAYVDMRQAPR